jgi:hypothetical protein
MIIKDPLGLLDLFLFIISHAVDLIIIVLMRHHPRVLVYSAFSNFVHQDAAHASAFLL